MRARHLAVGTANTTRTIMHSMIYTHVYAARLQMCNSVIYVASDIMCAFIIIDITLLQIISVLIRSAIEAIKKDV